MQVETISSQHTQDDNYIRGKLEIVTQNENLFQKENEDSKFHVTYCHMPPHVWLHIYGDISTCGGLYSLSRKIFHLLFEDYCIYSNCKIKIFSE